MKRVLTSSEERLPEVLKDYLSAHPYIVSLQPHMLASEALYQTLRHGAVTIERAIELDAFKIRQVKVSKTPLFDNYSNAEDSFIDQNGMSSMLC